MTFRPRLHRALTAASVVLMIAGGAALSVKMQEAERAALASPGAEPEEASVSAPLAGTVRPPAGTDRYWGAFRQDAPYARAEAQAVRDQAGEWPAILMWYQEWDGQPDFDVISARWLAARGVVPMVTWEPWRPPDVFGQPAAEQPRYALDRIAAGDFDAYIARYALTIRNYGGPVMLRPFHEMDGFWYPWGGTANGNAPGDLVPAWRHVHDVFEAMGATNVTWVWSVNHRSVPDTPENAMENYWPGRDYVDWIGISGFNWGTAGAGSVWNGLDHVYSDRYQELLRYKRPIAFTEIAAPEAGGDKAVWITESYAAILQDYPHVRAAIWYDKRDSDERDWRIASSPESQAAFRAAVSGAGYRGAPDAMRSATGSATG